MVTASDVRLGSSTDPEVLQEVRETACQALFKEEDTETEEEDYRGSLFANSYSHKGLL